MNRWRVIIDTDPGVDDAAAILLALASSEIELLGISVVAGNVGLEASVRNACKLVAVARRPDVPVYAGAARPLVRDQVFGKYANVGAFSDALVPATDVRPRQLSSVRFIADKAREAAASGHKITICAIGPQTNIALALLLHPDVAAGIEQIVVMGGAFSALGHRTAWSEYNVHADPHAADIVWNSGVPLVLFPLDVTMQALFSEDDFRGFEARGGLPGKCLARLLRAYDRSDIARYGRPGGPIHDAMTVAWLVRPELFQGQMTAIGVTVDGPTAGHTWADFYGRSHHAANAMVMKTANEAGFRQLLVERIANLGANITPAGENAA